jgi:hypothetical protein
MNPTFVALAALASWMPSWVPSWVPGHDKGPPPPMLWDGARVGMTPREILRRFPAARPTVAGDNLDGEAEGASMPVQVADHDAIAHFFFGRRGLGALTLSILDVEEGRTGGNLAEARELGDAVTKRYGPPGHCDVVNNTSPVRYRCEWASGALHIEIEYREAIPPPTLTVTYRVGAGASGAGL